ncbi:hypothetical protein X975_16937, partial [Stegodyphus mimosarum]
MYIMVQKSAQNGMNWNRLGYSLQFKQQYIYCVYLPLQNQLMFVFSGIKNL